MYSIFALLPFLLSSMLAHPVTSPLPGADPESQAELLTNPFHDMLSSATAIHAAPTATPLLYVAAYSGTVQTLRLDVADAKNPLEAVTTSRECGVQPSWLTLDKDKNKLYCVDEQGASLTVFEPDNAGTLKKVGAVDGLLAGPAHGVLHNHGNAFTLAN